MTYDEAVNLLNSQEEYFSLDTRKEIFVAIFEREPEQYDYNCGLLAQCYEEIGK
jgi:hypothetical protein